MKGGRKEGGMERKKKLENKHTFALLEVTGKYISCIAFTYGSEKEADLRKRRYWFYDPVQFGHRHILCQVWSKVKLQILEEWN